MDDLQIIWDLEDNEEGNYWHIVVEGHGVTQQEVDEVLIANLDRSTTSNSSDQPMTFGWTSMGQYIAVVFERIQVEPRIVYPITAYPVPPPRQGKMKKKRKK